MKFGARDAALDLCQRVGRQVGIEARQRFVQTTEQQRFLIIGAFGMLAVEGQVGPEGIAKAQFLEPIDGGLLDN
jgi:hypothetical protein